jgi:hypothetical protein
MDVDEGKGSLRNMINEILLYSLYHTIVALSDPFNG